MHGRKQLGLRRKELEVLHALAADDTGGLSLPVERTASAKARAAAEAAAQLSYLEDASIADEMAAVTAQVEALRIELGLS